MELSNEFVVGVSVDEAWKVLTDLERIAPCMPGAELQEVEGDEHRGVVKVKVGPITAQYKGKAIFVSRDENTHVAVLRAEGRDTRGQGNANATITATLTPAGEGTNVVINTDLQITGRAAQFGRGVMADVSSKLIGQFVDCLEKNVLTGSPEVDLGAEAVSSTAPAEPAASPAASATAAPAPRKLDYTPAAPVNLLDTAGAPVLKRLIPTVAGALVALLVIRKVLRGRG